MAHNGRMYRTVLGSWRLGTLSTCRNLPFGSCLDCFSMHFSRGKNTENLTMLQDTDRIGRRPVAQHWALVLHSN